MILKQSQTFRALVLLFLIGGFNGIAAHADSAAAYLHARHAHQEVLLSQSSLATVQQDPESYIGRALEVTGTVTGLVISGITKTALLNVAGETVCVVLPAQLKDTSCIEAGKTVRGLLMVEREHGKSGVPDILVIAAAPEYDVAQTERAAAAGWARRGSLTSRSVSYTTVRGSDPDVAGGQSGGGTQPAYAPPPHYADDGVGAPIAPLTPRARAIYGPYRTFIRKMNRNLDEAEVDKITTSILYYSDLEQIDPRLVMAMIIAESGFDPNSTSRKGAMGLGQLMPSTAAGMNVTDPYDSVQNIAASVHLLRANLDKYGGAPANAGIIPVNQIQLTMAAYNAGAGAVHKFHGVPPYRETQRYVAKVTALYQQMCARGR